jgi:two-component system nitrate/nitrite response regulator NarL
MAFPTSRGLQTTAPAAGPISVLLAGFNTLTRAGLRSLLGHDKRFRIAGEAGIAPGGAAHSLSADLLLLDPVRRDGFDPGVMSELRQAAPAARLAVLTGDSYPGSCAAAIHAGAFGYFLPAFAGLCQPFLGALYGVGRFGEGISDPAIVASFQASCGATIRAQIPRTGGGTLTEREVLRLAAEGLDDQQIAARLHIDVRTVEHHFAQARMRLGASNRFHLACLAKDLSLV